mgnify:CR=1 FL=1
MRSIHEMEIKSEESEEVERALEFAEDILYNLENIINGRQFNDDINYMSEEIIMMWADDYERLKNRIRETKIIINRRGNDSSDAINAAKNALRFAMLLEEKYAMSY